MQKHRGYPRAYWNIVRHAARKRAIPFELEIEEFVCLVQMDCFFCGVPPYTLVSTRIGRRVLDEARNFLTHALDRIDNDEGYVRGNVVPCCWSCNKVKNTMTVGELLCHLPRMLVGLTNFVSSWKSLESSKPYISVTDASSLSTARNSRLSTAPTLNQRERRSQASALKKNKNLRKHNCCACR
jgi:hypothetical protein